MGLAYSLGALNDNFFKQAMMLLAVGAGLGRLQGLAALVFALPFILFSAPAGWLADRWPKHRIVIATKVLELVIMLGGAWSMISLHWAGMLAVVFLMALQSALFGPALNGSIPEMYAPEEVPAANAFLKLGTTVAILLGISLAGAALDRQWLSTAIPFGRLLVAAMGLGFSVLGLAASLAVGRRAVAPTGQHAFPWRGPWDSCRDLLALAGRPLLLRAVLADAWFYGVASFAVLAINSLGLVTLARSRTMTSLFSTALMLGVCGGAFAAARLLRRYDWQALLFLPALGMGLGIVVAAAVLRMPPEAQNWAMLGGLCCSGVCGGIFLIPVTAYLQTAAGPAEKGRIIGLASFCSFCAIMLAGALFSACEHWLAPPEVMGALGLFILASGACWRRKPGTAGSHCLR